MTNIIIGTPMVYTSANGGLSVEQLTDIVMGKIMKVSDTAPEPIRQQAIEYKDRIHNLISHYLAEAKRSALSDFAYEAECLGYDDLAAAMRVKRDGYH